MELRLNGIEVSVPTASIEQFLRERLTGERVERCGWHGHITKGERQP